MTTTAENTNSAEGTMVENSKSRLDTLLDNIDTSAIVRKQLDAAQKKLIEVEQTIIVLTEQLANKANDDEELRGKVVAMVDNLRKLHLSDDVIAIAVSKQFNLSMPSPNRVVSGDSPNVPNRPNTEALAKKMGIDEDANNAIIEFVRTNKEGVGMKAIVEAFPEFVRDNQQRFAGYVRSLVETGKLVTTGNKKGTKYFAR